MKFQSSTLAFGVHKQGRKVVSFIPFFARGAYRPWPGAGTKAVRRSLQIVEDMQKPGRAGEWISGGKTLEVKFGH